MSDGMWIHIYTCFLYHLHILKFQHYCSLCACTYLLSECCKINNTYLYCQIHLWNPVLKLQIWTRILLLVWSHHLSQTFCSQVLKIEGVISYREPHFWSHTSTKLMGSLHVQVVPEASEQKIIAQVREYFSIMFWFLFWFFQFIKIPKNNSDHIAFDSIEWNKYENSWVWGSCFEKSRNYFFIFLDAKFKNKTE